jgi:pentatricopeptide repeat protein
MGSFHNIKDFIKDGTSWYRQSLRAAVADLRQDLHLDHDTPQLQKMETTLSDAAKVMEDLERMASASEENESTLSGLLQEVKILATRPYDNKLAASADVIRAFSLLDQFLQGDEVEQEDRLTNTNNFLDKDFLNPLVGKWKKCWKASWKNELPPEETEKLPTPWALADKLDNYQSLLVPDTTTCNYVLSVASHWKHQEETDGDGNLQLALFAQSVVEQMKLKENIRPNERTFNLLIKSWARAGSLKQVLGIIHGLREEGMELTVHSDVLRVIDAASRAQLATLSALRDHLPTNSMEIPTMNAIQRQRTTPASVGMDNNTPQRIQQWMQEPTGVDKAFRWLDRCVLSGSDWAKDLPSDLFFDLLMAWKKAWMRKTTNMAPRSIVGKVLLYHDRPNGFHAETRTFNLLIAALGSDDMEPTRALQWGQHLFQRMASGGAGPTSDSNTYKAMVQLYTKTGDIQGALDLLVSLRDDKTYNGSVKIYPECFDAILDACLKMEGNKTNLGNLAEGILDLKRELAESGRLPSEAMQSRTDRRLHNKAVQCWEKSGHSNAAEKIQMLLSDLGAPSYTSGDSLPKDDTQVSADADNAVRPNTIMVYSLIQTLAKQGKAREAQARLDQMCSSFEEGAMELEPNTMSFNAVLNAWADEGALKEAGELLTRMTQCYQSALYKQVRPNAFSYNCVIHACAKSHDPNAGDHALQWLEEMERRASHETDNNLSPLPTSRTYAGVIYALAKNGKAKMAEDVLQMMHRAAVETKGIMGPTTITYNSVLDAWARSGVEDAGINAERLLTRMYELHREGYKNVLPDCISYNSVFMAWGRSKSQAAGVECNRLFNEMLDAYKDHGHAEQLKPNGDTYGFLVYAWANAGDMKKAEELLRSYCVSFIQGQTDVAPDIRSLNCILTAWAESESDNAEATATRLLSEMAELSQSVHLRSMRPDGFSYGAVLKAISRSNHPGNGERAEAIWNEMLRKGIAPDVRAYCSLMHAWARQGNVSRVETTLMTMVDECFKRIKKRAQNREDADDIPTAPIVQPTVQCFNILLRAYCQSRDPEAGPKADALLKRMETLYQDGILPRAEPDRLSLVTTLWCWQQCSAQHPNAKDRIAGLLNTLTFRGHWKGDKKGLSRAKQA